MPLLLITVIFRFLTHSESCSVVSHSLQPHGLYSPWNSPDKNIGVGSHSLLQGFIVAVVQVPSHVRLLATPWTAACQASLSITNSQSLIKLMPIESMMSSNHLILVIPFSCLQSFPASASFQKSQFFTAGGQNIAFSASASVLPMKIQD